ncbi:DUF2510 domain-containing protein [Cellulomonas sp. P5_C6]
MPTTPASWYPDPIQPSRLRYWDGATWTGYLVDPERPTVVRYEQPPWAPLPPGGINVPLSVVLSAGF